MSWYISDEALLLFSFSKGVSFSRKKFAPRGANSFPEEWTPFEELRPPEKQTYGNDGVSIFETDGKYGG